MKFIKDVYWRIRNSTELVYCKLDYKDMSKFRLWEGDYTYFIHAPKVSVVICKECYKKIRDKFNEIENTFRMKVRKNEKIQKVTSCY